MNNFNEAFAKLMSQCEGSTTYLLVKHYQAKAGAVKALFVFDQISDYSPDVLLDPSARERLVAELLGKALEADSNRNN